MAASEPVTRKRLQRRLADRPTLHDVAAMAGVSTATVSRCLNEADAVRSELRERVQSAIAELGYTRHGAARALASQRSHAVGAVVPTLDNAIFATGIQAMQDRLSMAGYTLLLASSNYDVAEEFQQARSLIERGLDGLMLIGEARPPGLYELLDRKEIPYVNAWTYRPDSRHPSIGFDNRGSAYRIASYLMDMGHTRIAMIAGLTAGNDRAAERLDGVADKPDAGDHDDGRLGGLRFNSRQELQTVQAGQAQVAQHDVRILLAKYRESALAIVGLQHLEPAVLQICDDAVANAGLVFDGEDRCGGLHDYVSG